MGDKRKMTKEELKKEAYQFLIQATKEQRIMYFGGNLEELLADFAEPREKRIADLEKENADLKEEVNKIAFARGSLEEENSKLILGNKSLSERLTSVTREKLDLQKENAELKEDNSEWEKASDKWKSLYESSNNQLTKAKEILHKVCYEFGIYNKDLMEEAKQFLNSEVEE
jgi:regulator of replication initiation timing